MKQTQQVIIVKKLYVITIFENFFAAKVYEKQQIFEKIEFENLMKWVSREDNLAIKIRPIKVRPLWVITSLRSGEQEEISDLDMKWGKWYLDHAYIFKSKILLN